MFTIVFIFLFFLTDVPVIVFVIAMILDCILLLAGVEHIPVMK